MTEEQSAAECLTHLSQDKGFQKIAELAGQRFLVPPEVVIPYMMAVALEVSVVLMEEQLNRISDAVAAGDPLRLAAVLCTMKGAVDHFTALSMEASRAVGLDVPAPSWPEVIEDEDTEH